MFLTALKLLLMIYISYNEQIINKDYNEYNVPGREFTFHIMNRL